MATDFAGGIGRLIAFEAHNGKTVLVVTNPDESASIHPVLEFRSVGLQEGDLTVDRPWAWLPSESGHRRLRLNLPPEESAVVVVE